MKTPYDVVLKPVISEKSMEDAQVKKYTFKVAVDANKKINVCFLQILSEYFHVSCLPPQKAAVEKPF